MKKFIITSVYLVLTGFIAFTQVDRSIVPAPGPAPKIQIKNAESFTLKNGLRVFVVENHKIPKISYSLLMDIDPVNEGDKAGYVQMVGGMLTRGTKNRSKQQIDEEIDFIGASFSASSSGFYASSLKKHNNALLEIISDVMLNPTFPEEEFEKLKKQTLSGMATEKNEAGTIANNIRNAFVYGAGHPYSEIPTEESIEKITVNDIKSFYTKNFMPNTAYLAIVGDITKAEAQVLLEQYFGGWAKGTPVKTKLTTPQPPANPQVIIHDRPESKQTTLRFVYPVVLKTGDPDAIKLSVLANILGGGSTGRLYKNLRETNSYTYGAYCGFRPDKYIGYFSASADVRNAVTGPAVKEFIREFSTIASKGITAEELEDTKKEMQGDFARSLESPQTVAQFAINIARYKLPADYYQNYLINLNALTVEDINAAAKKYILPFNFYLAAVGVADSIAKDLTQFDSDQKLTFVDNYGREIKGLRPAPEGVTIQTVMDNYINATGGLEKLKEVKEYRIIASASIQGFTIDQTVLYKQPDKALIVVKAGDMVVQSVSINGGTGKQSNMQSGASTMTANEVKSTIAEMDLAFEANYASYGYTAELKGLENIKGKDYYMVEFVSPAGDKSKVYYDIKSGLKAKEISTSKGAEGVTVVTNDFSDYRDVNGIKIAHGKVTEAGPQVIAGSISSVELNPGLSDDLFK